MAGSTDPAGMQGRPSRTQCQVTAANLQLRSAGMGSEPARQPPSSCRASHRPAFSPPFCVCRMTFINKHNQNGLCVERASHACFSWLQSACSLCFSLVSVCSVPSPLPPLSLQGSVGVRICVFSQPWHWWVKASLLFFVFLPSNPFGS